MLCYFCCCCCSCCCCVSLCVCVCVCIFFSILVLVAIFEMGTIFMTRAPPSLISALIFIVCLCAFCFSIPVVVTIFVRRTIFMNCPPPSLIVCILLFYPSSSDDICQKDHFHELPTTVPYCVHFAFLSQ